ncbi:hypothetical protein B0H13DRAFT_1883812 [Mycena leptocephala]|nr:hypothetical protein B0H13DRAFT_1883812 [Mycena leptocephala]
MALSAFKNVSGIKCTTAQRFRGHKMSACWVYLIQSLQRKRAQAKRESRTVGPTIRSYGPPVPDEDCAGRLVLHPYFRQDKVGMPDHPDRQAHRTDSNRTNPL